MSVIHAEALWRPLPPVGYDDEGYPCESRNVTESSTHDDVLNYFRNSAFALLADKDDAMVQERLLILFEQGNPRAAVEPDITIALGVGRHHRNSYKIWIEGQPPDLVVEGLSQKTWRRDVDIKPALYGDLGIREFWQIDPLGRLPEPVTGYRLHRGVYQPIPPTAAGAYPSDVLNAELSYDRVEMSIRNLATRERIPPLYEVLLMRDEALRQRDEERKARQEALARIAELEARLKR